MAEYDIYIGFHFKFIIIIIIFPPSFLFLNFFPNPHWARMGGPPPPPDSNFFQLWLS